MFYSILWVLFGLLLPLVGVWLLISFIFRQVVPTNMVHIIQSSRQTISYGAAKENGNVYYRWPSWIPVIGIEVIELPVSNFDLKLSGYNAYDKNRVPFDVDVTAFFRIDDTNTAAKRVESAEELHAQLQEIVQGAVRKILASHNIDHIMLERDTFGTQFTEEVKDQLQDWGVVPVKNMELMDIRDAQGNQVIHNIMAKKKSFVEMESRKEVAENIKIAEIAEIDAKQATEVREQEAQQIVGQRTAEKEREVGIAKEKAQQQINDEKAVTTEKQMAIIQVEQVRQAEITKQKQVVNAEQDRETTVIRAEGALEAKRKEAEGVKVEGEAKAEAEKLMQLAPVQAQIELAKEIGQNKVYQQYLIALEAVAAYKQVGMEQSKALINADLKVISNAGDVVSGVNNVMELLTPKGGTALSGSLEALANTEVGRAMIERLGIRIPTASETTTSQPESGHE